MDLKLPINNAQLNTVKRFSCEALLFIYCFALLLEIPNDPVTVYQDDKVRVELIFNAEVSNVLIVNARALGEDSLDLNVTFEMSNVSEMAYKLS